MTTRLKRWVCYNAPASWRNFWMTENKRVPAHEDAVDAARDKKEAHGESWTDVFEFYVERRDEADVARKWTEAEIREIAEDVCEGYANGGRR